jgi:hypothetical protein
MDYFRVLFNLFHEVTMTGLNKLGINIFSLLFDRLIDLALTGMGILLYYQFNVQALASEDLSPIVVNSFGSEDLAVLVISGVPFIIGIFSLIRMPIRTAWNVPVLSKPD